MKALKSISRLGIIVALFLFLIVVIIDSFFPHGEMMRLGQNSINTSTASNMLFIVSLVILTVSMFLRIVGSEKEWKELISFSKYFIPIAVVFFGLSVFLHDGNNGLFGSPCYWIGISIVIIYGLAMLYFALKTFYQRW
ncbi:MAG: hypothetical protein U9M90_01890 [Patescibacteria group bacterium]|nr:hypothetical protein [Patescibacteria group bacterium]